MFSHRRLYEFGFLEINSRCGRDWTSRLPALEEAAVETIESNSHKSTTGYLSLYLCMAQQCLRNVIGAVVIPILFPMALGIRFTKSPPTNGYYTFVFTMQCLTARFFQHVFCSLMKTYFLKKVLFLFITAIFVTM